MSPRLALTLALALIPAVASAQPVIGALPPLPAAGAYAIERLPSANEDPGPAIQRALRDGAMRGRLAAQCASAPVVAEPMAGGMTLTSLARLGAASDAPRFQRRATTRCAVSGPIMTCNGGGLTNAQAGRAGGDGGRYVLNFGARTSVLHPCFGPHGVVTAGGQPLFDAIVQAMR